MDISRECVLPTIFARHPAVYIHARVNTFVTYLVEATKTNVCICVCSCLTPSFVVAYYPTLSSGPLTSGSLLRKALAGRSTDSFSLPTLLLLSLALSLSLSLLLSLSFCLSTHPGDSLEFQGGLYEPPRMPTHTVGRLKVEHIILSP